MFIQEVPLGNEKTSNANLIQNLSSRRSQFNRYKKITDVKVCGRSKGALRLGPEGKQGGTGRTKETRAGRASRENVQAGEVTRSGVGNI